MRPFGKERGAISVFLVIVLVPCIVVAGIFVDVSRVSLAKSVSTASADLALNSVMTQYDPDLSKFYGLMASSQDMADAYKKAGQYYKELLLSQGFSDDEAGSISAELKGILEGTTDTADLFKMEVADSGDSGIITPVKDANLANPTLMRNQIVEFMKYRGPIDLARSAYELLKQLGGAYPAIKDAEADEKIIDKKKDFYEKVDKLSELTKEIYDEITAYQGAEYLSGYDAMIANLNGEFNEKYKGIHHIIIKNAVNEKDGIDLPEGVTLTEDEKTKAEDEIKNVYHLSNAYYYEADTEKEALDKIKSDVNKLDDKIEACKNAKIAWENAINAAGDTELAKQDQEELDNAAKDTANVISLINDVESGKISVAAFQDRYSSIVANLKEVKDSTGNVKYGTNNQDDNSKWKLYKEKKVKEIDSLSKTEALVDTSFFKDKSKGDYQETSNVMSRTFSFKNAGLPDYKKQDASFEGDSLYNWMSGIPVVPDTSKEASEKKAYNDMKEKGKDGREGNAEDEIDKSKTVPNIVEKWSGDAASFPSGLSGNGKISWLSSLISLAGSLVSDSLDATLLSYRDALYSAEYAKGMFSYWTIKEEEENRQVNENEKLKSLTLNDINDTNNFAMNGELEYILYGKGGINDIIAASSELYEIRYLFNLPSAFLNFYASKPLPLNAQNAVTANAILGMSMAVQTATGGWLPHQLVQIAFLLALTAIETGIDLYDLLGGHAVMLYKKTGKEWTCSFEESGLSNSASGALDELDGKVGAEGKKTEKNIDDDGKLYLFYSDYIYLFMLMGFNDDKAQDMYKRMGDLMQASIRNMGGSSFAMSKATVYYKLETEVTVPPLMLALPISTQYTNGSLKGWTFKEKMIRGYQ